MSILWLDGHSLGDHSSPFVKYSLIPQDWLVKIDQVCDLEPALTFTVFLNIRAACVGLCVAKVCSVRNNRGSVLTLFFMEGATVNRFGSYSAWRMAFAGALP
jgi:hypothetical protein